MAYLEIVEGDSRGKTVRLGAEVVIGRTSDNALCLPDSNVSRQHAVVRQKDNYFVIVDLGSANGTSVNKRGLHRHVPQPLYEGDEIVIGSARMLFRSEGQDPLAVKKKNVAGTRDHSQRGKAAALCRPVHGPHVRNRRAVGERDHGRVAVRRAWRA